MNRTPTRDGESLAESLHAMEGFKICHCKIGFSKLWQSIVFFGLLWAKALAIMGLTKQCKKYFKPFFANIHAFKICESKRDLRKFAH